MEPRPHAAVVVPFAIRVTDASGQVTARPVEGRVMGPRLTVPAKLSTLVKVIVRDAPVAPLFKLTSPRAEIWKPPTWIFTVATCTAVPGNPEEVIVTE